MSPSEILLSRQTSHEGNGPAYIMKKSATQGRCLVAARDLKEGDLIVTECPLAVGPDPTDSTPSYCVGCLKELDAYIENRCAGCDWPACSTQCYGLIDPLRHRPECQTMGATRSNSDAQYSPLTILLFRCLFLQKRDPQKWKVLLEMADDIDDAWRTGKENAWRWRSLVVNVLPNRAGLEEDILAPLRDRPLTKKFPDFTEHTVLKVAVLVNTLALIVNNPTTGKWAAVTEVSSFLKHSCLPNTRVYYDHPVVNSWEKNSWRARITVKAAMDIKKGDHLTTSIVDPMMPTYFRQREIYLSRNVFCDCKRCLDPTELGSHIGSMKCANCKQHVLPLDVQNIQTCDWQCSYCGGTVLRDRVYDLLEQFTIDILPLTSPFYFTTGRVKALAMRFRNFLPPENYFCTVVKCVLAKEIGYDEHAKETLFRLPDEDLKKKTDMCQEVLAIITRFGVVGQSYAYTIAGILAELVYTNLEVIKRKFYRKELTAVEANAEVNENRKRFVRAMRLYCAKYVGPEEIHAPENSGQQRQFLNEGIKKKQFGLHFVPDEFLTKNAY